MAEGNNIIPPSQERSHDITGKNCDEVVEILKSIVNNKDQYKKKAVFRFKISPASSHPQHSQASEKIYQLRANPTEDQPGNGRIDIWQDGKFIAGRAYDEEMVKDLKETYTGDTSAFARDMNTLFQNNETIAKYPFVTSELYMLLLFEIGRRLVKNSPKSTERKKKFDAVLVKEAIKGILTLFVNKECGFHEVFLKEGKFHCFSDPQPEQRKKVAEEIIEKALLLSIQNMTL